ncbi:MAG TPA: hypothetical protein IAB46_06305 [Candidatus Scybalocola faecigallinarum]|uniref:Uncharacterized protein n=1 Tax=Candidatus Scybalocola faecigallinarum TaxID=2840941 RepID=A0A9D1JQW7_9FIRM|nr:hypothetical protein [Candidatus Scybalocola faecigallinarum]
METELFNGKYFFQKIDWDLIQARPDSSGVSEEVRFVYSDGVRTFPGILWIAYCRGQGWFRD